ncbi:heat shock factor protein 2-like isoform X3 [Rana temporaria]|uniref:heat shock factor protein 2-like isoform X3 n=1 Tax=Rana temporaria TaxID=8407 RepID=UPI001AACECDC|nr:heat shock factor protein 2-like isoform X3 [Rana temporaria]
MGEKKKKKSLKASATLRGVSGSHVTEDGNSFIVLDEESFAKEILPRHFKHNNMASFVRQLNWYGFHKVMQDESGAARHDKYCSGRYQQPFFKRGQEELLIKIKRKVTSSTGDKRLFRKAKVSVPRIEEGTSGPDDMQKILTFLHQLQARQDVLDSTVESLKRENEALWKEVVQLRPAQPQFEPVGTSHSYEPISSFQSNQPLMIDSTGNYNQLSASKTSQTTIQAFENRSPWYTEEKASKGIKRAFGEDHDGSTEEPSNHLKSSSLHRGYENYNTDESDDPSDLSSYESELVINEDTASNLEQSFTNPENSVANHRKPGPHKRLKSYAERQDSTIKRRIVYSGSENEDEQKSCRMDSGSVDKSNRSCRSSCYKMDQMVKQMHRDHTRLTKKVLTVEQQSLQKLSEISTALSTLSSYIMNTQNPQRASYPPFVDAAKHQQIQTQGSQSHRHGLWSDTSVNHSTKREYES